jgi:cell division protein FtsI/penicillin-binding protein 2
VTQVYEPGSVFKLVTFSAALQHGIITPNQAFTVPGALPLGGYIFHDAESHGTETLTASQILAQSSNIGTIEITQKLGEKRLLAQIGNLGFGHPTGLHFPGASPGLVLGPSQWTGSSIGSTPIGQDDGVSPLQLLDAYNAVANGGVMVQPRLVQATVAPNGSVSALPPSPTRRVIARSTDAELIPMFEGVVADSNGTGTLGAIDGYTVAGKTGTSNMPSHNHLGYTPGAFYATFVGFAPATRPVLSAVVMLKHPTPVYGGAVSAPVFSTIMKYALQHYGIPTDTAVTPSTSSGAIGAPVTLPSNPLQGA